MKKLLYAMTALSAFVVSAPAFAAVDDTSATANVTAKIIRPISVTNNSGLAFGTIVKPSTGSNTVTVDTAGARAITGGGDAVALGSTSANNAQFTIGGEGGQSISVVVPASFNLTGPGSITVTTSNDIAGDPGLQTLSGTLGGGGTLVVKVGGSFSVDGSTATGDYTGSFNVQAYYN